MLGLMVNMMTFLKIDESDKKEFVPGARVCFVHSQNMTLAYWTFAPGALLPEHSHPHEQVSNIIEGEFDLMVDGKTERLGPGHVAVIPPNAVHSGKALTLCRVIDAFYPVREDYR